jgi:hypothetical protein
VKNVVNLSRLKARKMNIVLEVYVDLWTKFKLYFSLKKC